MCKIASASASILGQIPGGSVSSKITMLAVVLASALGTASTSHSQKAEFTAQDAANLSALVAREQQTNQNNIEALAAPATYNCISELVNIITQLHYELSTASILLHLSIEMVSPEDREKINRDLQIILDANLAFLLSGREVINSQSHSCGSDPTVLNRTKAALSVFDDAEHLLLDLNRHF